MYDFIDIIRKIIFIIIICGTFHIKYDEKFVIII